MWRGGLYKRTSQVPDSLEWRGVVLGRETTHHHHQFCKCFSRRRLQPKHLPLILRSTACLVLRVEHQPAAVLLNPGLIAITPPAGLAMEQDHKKYIRSIVRRVHPDLFGAHPYERNRNAESLKVRLPGCTHLAHAVLHATRRCKHRFTRASW